MHHSRTCEHCAPAARHYASLQVAQHQLPTRLVVGEVTQRLHHLQFTHMHTTAAAANCGQTPVNLCIWLWLPQQKLLPTSTSAARFCSTELGMYRLPRTVLTELQKAAALHAAHLAPAVIVACPALVAVELLIVVDERLNQVPLASKPTTTRCNSHSFNIM
jgi:hypothetical protein